MTGNCASRNFLFEDPDCVGYLISIHTVGEPPSFARTQFHIPRGAVPPHVPAASRPHALSPPPHPVPTCFAGATTPAIDLLVAMSEMCRAAQSDERSRGVPAPASVGVWITRILRLAPFLVPFLRSRLPPAPSPLRVSTCFLSHTEAR